MKIFDIVSEDVTALNTQPKLGKLPHEEVESVIHQWVNQEDHIELSNGMHVLSGENHGYEDNMALIVDTDYKVLDNDTNIVDLMQQFTAQEIDPEIVENKNKKPQLPKQNNPVAKHSRNMAGAGAHKSPKDYDRKNKKKDISSQLDEGPYIASRSDIVHSVMRELEAKAHVDDNFLHHLAELVGKKLTQRNQDNHRGRWVSQKK